MKKYVLLALPFICITGCGSKNLTKHELIEYINAHYTSKEPLTPPTFIEFKTNNFNNNQAKEKIITIANYGYNIKLDKDLNGNKNLNTKEEFLAFYENPFIPLNANRVDELDECQKYTLLNNEIKINTSSTEDEDIDEKEFIFNINGYERRRIEIFKRNHSNFSFMITITSTYSY